MGNRGRGEGLPHLKVVNKMREIIYSQYFHLKATVAKHELSGNTKNFQFFMKVAPPKGSK